MSKDIQKAALRVKEFFKEMEPQSAVRLKRSLADDSVDRTEFCPATLPDLPESIKSISVTDLSRYARCPYRFYLEKLRRFKKVDDDAAELDFKDFGNVIHKILEDFGKDDIVRNSRSAEDIRDCLDQILNFYSEETFGKSPSTSLSIQIARVRDRLHRFADWQAERRGQGYEIVDVEYMPSKTVTLGEIPLCGQIDRIDCRVAEDGKKEFVVIDYKTGKPEKIAKILKEKENWKDFQMPLYQYILEKSGYVSPGDTVKLVYLMIPGDDKDFKLKEATWTPDEVEKAQRRAEAIVKEIVSMDWKTVTPNELDKDDKYDDFAYICMSGLEP